MSMQSRVPLGPGKFHVVVLVIISSSSFKMAIQACVRKKHFPLILVMVLLILTTFSCDDV